MGKLTVYTDNNSLEQINAYMPIGNIVSFICKAMAITQSLFGVRPHPLSVNIFYDKELLPVWGYSTKGDDGEIIDTLYLNIAKMYEETVPVIETKAGTVLSVVLGELRRFYQKQVIFIKNSLGKELESEELIFEWAKDYKEYGDKGVDLYYNPSLSINRDVTAFRDYVRYGLGFPDAEKLLLHMLKESKEQGENGLLLATLENTATSIHVATHTKRFRDLLIRYQNEEDEAIKWLNTNINPTVLNNDPSEDEEPSQDDSEPKETKDNTNNEVKENNTVKGQKG